MSYNSNIEEEEEREKEDDGEEMLAPIDTLWRQVGSQVMVPCLGMFRIMRL